jgi:hypothetical protein
MMLDYCQTNRAPDNAAALPICGHRLAFDCRSLYPADQVRGDDVEGLFLRRTIIPIPCHHLDRNRLLGGILRRFLVV